MQMAESSVHHCPSAETTLIRGLTANSCQDTLWEVPSYMQEKTWLACTHTQRDANFLKQLNILAALQHAEKRRQSFDTVFVSINRFLGPKCSKDVSMLTAAERGILIYPSETWAMISKPWNDFDKPC